MGAFRELVVRLDSTSTTRKGAQFERICQWYLTADPVYAAQLRRVWLWNEWPGRWGIDAGIDLVAEDHDGQLWAIQAKAYDPAYRVTKKDVNRFLAEAGRPMFAYRLLIATTNLIDKIAERTIQGQGTASFVNLAALERAEVDWPSSPEALRPAKRIAPKKPRPHQREAINAVVQGFETADRGQLIMACGTGKTLAALFIKEKVAANRTLVLLPSLSLLKQTLREWTANSTREFEFRAVCSDDTVVDDDAAVSHTSVLGVPVTTSPTKIAGFLRRRSGPRVVFATYQSSPQIAKAFKLGRVPGFDLVVADEAHRCAGPTTSEFATILDPTKIKSARRLFMTATPRYFTGRIVREAKEADYEVASMDDEAKFGTVFHRLPFGEAIERELLTDYQVAVVGVDDATYREWAERGELVILDGSVSKTDARTLAGQIGLAKAMKKYDLHRTITFHSRVKRASDFARSMPEVLAWMPVRQRPKGALWADFASGEMSAGDREIRLRHLAVLDVGERGVLANARCLAEGVDVPTLDGVAFIDPRRSEVDIVQAVGRAIRKSSDKTVGTIVIPVFIDTDEDPEAALDDSVFKPVWDVIKALRSHDEELGEQLDELRRNLGKRRGIVKPPSKIHLDLPSKVGREFADAFDVRLVERTTASWEFWFGKIQEFAAEHGHARVGARYVTAEGFRLGAWVANQRSHYAKGTLKTGRAELLETVAGWTWDPVADYWVDQWAEQWEEGFRQLQRYVDKHADARVPSDHTTSDGYRLGWWTVWQRELHGKGELDEERERRLCALPGWSWDVRAEQWEEGFRQLKLYVDQHGDARVPKTFVMDGFTLGVWVAVQRRGFSRGTMEVERRERLEALPGWSWDPFADAWEEGFRWLLDYVAQKGNSLVPRSYVVDGYALGAWVKKQRGIYNRGELAAERERRLQELPGWSWDPFTEQWEEGFRQLCDYVKQRGNALVPHTFEFHGFNLGSWVAVQRRKYALGAISPDRQLRLEELPGWKWATLKDKWEDGFQQLAKYVDVNGDARVPRFHVTDEGYRLGPWINVQRNAFKAGTLDPERVKRLQALPGWTFDTRADQWEEGFQHLLEYVEQSGGADVPSSYTSADGYRLGQWVGGQRNAYAKGTLPKDRENRLTALPGWSWNSKRDKWDQFLSLLIKYASENGNVRVPGAYEANGLKLGVWVRVQRANFNRGVLNPERVRRLSEVPGWSWDPFDTQWEQGFAKLVEYVAEHGDARVPGSYIIDGFRLGGWVQKQRNVFNKSNLDAERRSRLETLPGWTWTPPKGGSARRP